MRRSIAAIAAAVAAAALVSSCSPRENAPPRAAAPVALVVTPSESADSLVYRSVAALVAADASPASERGRQDLREEPGASIRQLVLPDAPTAKARASELSALLLESAKDPLVRAVLVIPALPGTAEAFRELRARRRDVACIAADPTEERLSLEAAADLVVELDRLYRPYLAAVSASAAGARGLVAATPPGRLPDASSRELAVLRASCADLGLEFRVATAGPDERGGDWLGGLGAGSALYCADAALADAVISAAVESGAAVVDGGPESLDACYRVLAPRLPEGAWKADEARRFKLLEKAASTAAGRGRIAVWTLGYEGPLAGGLAELARRVASGSARVDEAKDLVAALKARSPGGAWIAAYDADPGTGVKASNHVLVRQDPYALGRGYAQSALRQVPAKYLSLPPEAR